jgi:DNA-binding LacI/PurR family transcriptional regulator
LRDYRADALLFLGGDIFDESTRRALTRELKNIGVYGALALAVAGDHADLPAIDIDHAAAAEAMTMHLIGLGHRRIGFVSGPMKVSTARYRREGFLRAMQNAALPADLIEVGDFTYTSGQMAGQRLLELEPGAIFAANDQMALGVLAACRAAGVAVPDKISVVGFGDTSAAQHAVPALTTVSMPRHQLGVEAMQAVLDALEAPESRQRAVIKPRRLPFQLVIRESSQ